MAHLAFARLFLSGRTMSFWMEFGSLSQIAKAMTGTNWNGHRFFGLRQGRTLAADAGADHRKSKKMTCPCRTSGASAEDAP